MYKIAILGCENSHANGFIEAFTGKDISDVEFVGIYSEYEEAAETLHEKYGIPIMKSADELVGKVDGILVTARHGKSHYEFAKPYIESGIPMFIDKPITVSEQEAVEFMTELKKNNIRISGGSCVPLEEHVQNLKKAVVEKTYGDIVSGYVCAPLNMDNPYGGFFFYSQHAVQIACELFGFYPDSVMAYRKNNTINCIIRYNEYDIVCELTEGSWIYSASIRCMNDFVGGSFKLTDCFQKEYCAYHDLLNGGEQTADYKEFIAPVFVMNAIYRSLESGKEEKVNKYEV